MMKKDFEKYRRRLQTEYHHAVRLVAEMSERDRATDAFAGQIERKRDRIESALNRLREGTYGTCLACGDPIQGERLDNLPYAELCLHCQQNRERGNE
jgi:RNA polymerase-binding transcription factor DksA